MDRRKIIEDFFTTIMQEKHTFGSIPLDCSKGEIGFMLYLEYMENEISASKISEVLDISLPRVIKLITTLKEKELVDKKVDKEDKRKIIVYITEKGRKYVIEKRKKALDNMLNTMNVLTDEEMDTYIRISKKLINNIKEIKNKRGG